MLALVPYLRERDGIAVDEVAKDFGVPPAQIVKDLKVLWFCGLPNSVTGDMIDIDMEALDERRRRQAQQRRLPHPTAAARPARGAGDDGGAARVARGQPARASARRSTARSPSSRLRRARPRHRRPSVDIHVDPVDAAIRAAVEEALRQAAAAPPDATTCPAATRPPSAIVDPMRLIFFDGQGYLEGWCHRAEEVRMFRLDRITAGVGARRRRRRPRRPRAHDLSKDLFQPDPEDPLAVLDLDPAGSLGGRVLPDRGVRRSSATGGCGSGCGSATPAGCSGWCCGSAATPPCASPTRWPRRSEPEPRRRSPSTPADRR